VPFPRSPIGLTFDDGPDERWTLRVLEELALRGVVATFFVLGERVEAIPAVVRAVIDAGHEVQLHGHRHLRHSELTEEEIELDTRAALDALAHVGVRPTRWRTPWGIATPASERVAARHRLTLVHWTIDTHDWRGDPALAMLARARRALVPGAVVLMHDGLGPGAMRSGCENTVELLAPLIAAARARSLAPAAAVPATSDRSARRAPPALSSSREHGAPQPLGAPR
jgi:peptidoglycan/xylan/chitin deacetylase (PgdA/CDA1 family)